MYGKSLNLVRKEKYFGVILESKFFSDSQDGLYPRSGLWRCPGVFGWTERGGLVWVLDYKGISGNEKADQLARL